jgi:arylsulfatase A-like enzyme
LKAATPNKPNVIFIYADDFGKGLISAYGQKQFTTPTIDRLIKEGVSFNRAYGGTNTASSRASLLTGYNECTKKKWVITNGGVMNVNDTFRVALQEEFVNRTDVFLEQNDLYLPQVFSKAGYVTGQIGMLGWGTTNSRKRMKAIGWDYYYGYLDLLRSAGYYPPFLFDNGKIEMIEGNTRPDCGKTLSPETEAAAADRHNFEGKKVYAPDLFLNKAIDFIRTFKDNSFFLLYSTQLPHGPVAVPAISPEVQNNPNLTEVEKEYASMVKLLDSQIETLLTELQTLGIEEQTMIVFSSDNGHYIYYLQPGRIELPFVNKSNNERFNDSYLKYYGYKAGDVFNGNGELAGLRKSNLEGGFSVPLVFYQKGKLKNRVSEDVVVGYDFLPTMADMLGVRLETPKDGISYLPLLYKNKHLSSKRFIILSSETGPAIIVNNGWKLRYFSRKKSYELYNLKTDRAEKYDVILRYPEKAEELKKLLLEELDGGDVKNGIILE